MQYNRTWDLCILSSPFNIANVVLYWVLYFWVLVGFYIASLDLGAKFLHILN